MLIIKGTHSSPTEMRCWPMRRTISWSVWVILNPGGCTSPLVGGASPLRWCGGAPLATGWWCGWCMAAGWAGGDSLRVRLRGGRWPAPSSPDPESVEARLARSAPRPRRAPRSAEIKIAPAASASSLRPRDVTAARYALPALNRPSPFVRRCRMMLLRCSPVTAFRPQSGPVNSFTTLVRPRKTLNAGQVCNVHQRTQKSAENETTAVFLR